MPRVLLTDEQKKINKKIASKKYQEKKKASKEVFDLDLTPKAPVKISLTKYRNSNPRKKTIKVTNNLESAPKRKTKVTNNLESAQKRKMKPIKEVFDLDLTKKNPVKIILKKNKKDFFKVMQLTEIPNMNMSSSQVKLLDIPTLSFLGKPPPLPSKLPLEFYPPPLPTETPSFISSELKNQIKSRVPKKKPVKRKPRIIKNIPMINYKEPFNNSTML